MIGFQSYTTEESIAAAVTAWITPFASAIESDSSVTVGRPVVAGVVDRLGIYITTNSVSATSTVTMEIDDVDSALVVSITASTTGFYEDTSNAPSVTNDQKIVYKVAAGSTGTALGWTRLRARFAATTNETSLIGCNSAGSTNHSTNSDTSYFALEGSRDLLSDETLTQYEHLAAGTLADLYVLTGTCTRTGDTVTFRSRIGSVNGNQSLSMTGDASNTAYQDTSNTDTISANNLVNASSTTGVNAGSFNYEKITASFTSTASQYISADRSSSQSQRVNDNVTAWFPAGGYQGVEEVSTEANVQMDMPEEVTVKLLSVYLDRMTGTVSTTTTFRDDSAQAGSISVALSSTGYAEDTSNSAVVAAGSEVNVQITSPVGGTNYDINYIGWVGELSGGGFGDGAGAVSTSSAVLGVGASVHATAGAVSASSTAAGIGAALADAVGAATGDSTVAGIGEGSFEAVGAVSTSSTVVAVSASEHAAAGAVSTSSTVAAVATSIYAAAGAVTTSSTAAALGASLADAVGAATGDSTVAAVGEGATGSEGAVSTSTTVAGIGASIYAAVGAVTTSSTVAGIGSALADAVGAATGDSTVAAIGEGGGAADGTGTVATSSTVAGIGASIYAGAGAVSTSTTVAAVGASLVDAVGAATGSTTVAAEGFIAGDGDGAVSTSTTVAGIGEALFDGLGSVSTSTTALGIGASIHAVVGTVATSSTVAAIGAWAFEAVGAVATSSTATAVGLDASSANVDAVVGSVVSLNAVHASTSLNTVNASTSLNSILTTEKL